MRRKLAARLGLHEEEAAAALLLGASYFLLLVSHYFLKPARDALFLTGASPAQLPLVFMASALVAAPATAFYARAGRRLSLDRLSAATVVVLALCLLALRPLLGLERTWVYYLFYAFVGIYGVLATAQFWLVANVLFDSVQARRVFPALGMAGIFGAVVGGLTTGQAVEHLGIAPADLTWAALGLLLASGALLVLAWPRRRARANARDLRASARRDARRGHGEGLRLVLRSRHLSLMVGLIAVSVMVTAFVDYQFKTVTFASLSEASALTTFLGRFYALVSLLSLFIQVMLTNRLLRWLGAVGALLILPALLAFGTAAMLAGPVMAAGLLLRGSDLALKHSLDKTGRELLYLPVPRALMERTKVAIDLIVDRWGRGLAGLLLLGLTAGLGLGVRGLGGVVAGLVIVWISLLLLLRGTYRDAFRAAIARRSLDAADLRGGIGDAATAETVLTSLSGGNERQILYALGVVPALKDADAPAAVRPLLGSNSAAVRRGALASLAEVSLTEAEAAARDLIADPDLGVRRRAVGVLAAAAGPRRAEVLEELLRGPTPGRNAALDWIAEGGDEADIVQLDESLGREILADTAPDAAEGRRVLASALRHAQRPFCRELLGDLLEDADRGVAREAVRSLGRVRDMRRLPWLTDRLAARGLRDVVRGALRGFGPDALLALDAVMGDPERGPLARRLAARVLGGIPQPETAAILLSHAPDADALLRDEILAQLERLRLADRHLRTDREAVGALLRAEAGCYYACFQARRRIARAPAGDAARLLLRSLDERQRQQLVNVFALLALRYPPHEVRDAGRGVLAGGRTLRANAVTYLEQILSPRLRAELMPMIEGAEAAILSVGRERFGVDLRDLDDALAYLAEIRDPWLRACAVYLAAAAGTPRSRGLILGATDDPSPLVRETVELVEART